MIYIYIYIYIYVCVLNMIYMVSMISMIYMISMLFLIYMISLIHMIYIYIYDIQDRAGQLGHDPRHMFDLDKFKRGCGPSCEIMAGVWKKALNATVPWGFCPLPARGYRASDRCWCGCKLVWMHIMQVRTCGSLCMHVCMCLRKSTGTFSCLCTHRNAEGL